MPESKLLLALPEPRDAEPLASLQALWRAADIDFEILYFHNQVSDEALEAEFRGALSHAGSPILGGFSRGARIAATIAGGCGARALLCLGYPFHKHGQAGEQHGLAILRTLTLPTLIVQGTRDAHGNREEVRGYGALPPSLRLHWLVDGNHRWQARAKSGQDHDELLHSAAKVTIDFIRDSLLSPHHE